MQDFCVWKHREATKGQKSLGMHLRGNLSVGKINVSVSAGHWNEYV